MPKPNQTFFVYRIQSKEKSFTEEFLLKKRCRGRLNKKRKEECLTDLATTIKKDPTISIRKHANELKFHEKT